MKSYFENKIAMHAYIRAAVTEAVKKDLYAIGTSGEIDDVLRRAELLKDIQDEVDENLESAKASLEKYLSEHPEAQEEAK